jgi:hypothetical protein
MNRAVIGFLSIVAACLPLSGLEIRVSLLTDDSVLNDTSKLLRQNGSSSESVEAFKKAVQFHKTDLFDATPFPKPEAGFHPFNNVTQLNQAIPDPFCLKVTTNDMNHNSLACLDIVVLLIKDAGAKAPRLRDDFANKHFAKQESVDGSDKPAFIIKPATSPEFYKDGRTLLYPTNGYTWITGLTRASNEVDLAVSLKGERQLPGKFEDTDESIKTLFADWNKLREKDGLQFPEKIKVVSCGYIPMKYHYWAIDHLAACLKHQGKLIYLEKNGPRGPFLRVDFNNENELGDFVANKLLPDSRNPKVINFGAPVFVAINDRLVRIARP